MFGGAGMWEMAIVGVIALLLFGKRLPEVARSLGQGLMEFKKGMSGIETGVNDAIYRDPPKSTSKPVRDDAEDEETSSAPKFEVPQANEQQTNEEKEPV